MQAIKYLTAWVLARRSLNLKLGFEVVLWADLLLEQGFECDEVKNIIQLDALSSDAQKEKAIDDCLTQLEVSLLDEKSAHLALIWAWAQRLINANIGVNEFLDAMNEMCVQHSHEPVYMQFYLLRCAKADLSKGNSIVFHDRELNGNNFEQILRREIELFIDENEYNILDWIQIKYEK